jgi:hypothetical protein
MIYAALPRWREELNCVKNSVCFCVVDMNSVAAVVIWGGTELPSIHTIWVPVSALFRFFMGYDTPSWRGHLCFVKVIMAIELRVCRDRWINP